MNKLTEVKIHEEKEAEIKEHLLAIENILGKAEIGLVFRIDDGDNDIVASSSNVEKPQFIILLEKVLRIEVDKALRGIANDINDR